MLWRIMVVVLVCSGGWATGSSAADELSALLDRVLAYEIKPAAGFTTKVLVPPGQLYDPLVLHPQGDVVWLNDDGKEEQGKGSRLIAVQKDGTVSILVDADKMRPISAGFDVAPEEFGPYGGQIFALSQPETGDQGGMKNYVIQRIDPQTNYAVSDFCTLPTLSQEQVSGIGVDARFGPTGSPFAGKLYASTTLNHTIYQVTPAGTCTPFVTFDAQRHGSPLYLRFTPDGTALYVTVVRGGIFAAQGSAVLRVLPDGTVEDHAVAEAPTMLGSLDFAPDGFGRYAGQLFVVEVGHYEIPVPLGHALRADGKVHRVTSEGQLELVASGFINPWGLRFVENTLWISDINGDFIYGKRELPDGFIVEISAQ